MWLSLIEDTGVRLSMRARTVNERLVITPV